jgi:putative ABC transport system substrate-binding protein
MKRRELVALIGGAAASCVSWPLAARAQPGKVWRIGMLDTTSAQLNAPNLNAFRQGLRQLGYVEGQTSSSTIARPTDASTGFRNWRPS